MRPGCARIRSAFLMRVFSCRSPGATLLAAAVGLAVSALAPVARADGAALDGKWRQGPLREDYTVHWMAACGPSPKSTVVGGGEIVEVRTEGDELAFLGGGRVFRTNQCYDPMPKLAREMHTREPSGRSWRTRCATPAGDPRRALLQTLVTATSDAHIDVRETGRYEVVLAEGRCTADIVRSRSYDLVTPAAAATASAAPAVTASVAPPKIEEPRAACVPGEAARLEVRPSRKLLRAGESFVLRALVVDPVGCPTGTAVAFSFANEADRARVTIVAGGNVTAREGAAEGEIDIVVAAAGKTTHAIVEIAAEARYEELLTRSGLNSKGENDNASVALIGSVQIGASEVKVEDARARRNVFLGVIGVALSALAVVFVVMTRRAKRAKALEAELERRQLERAEAADRQKREKREAYDAQLRAHEESVARAKAEEARPRLAVLVLACPACGKEYSDGTAFCATDGSELQTVERALAPTGKVCPACGRGYEAASKTCAVDGEELVPYAVLPSRQSNPPQAKICPTCGDRFDGSAGFCGKDGTVLVLLN